MRSKKGYQNFCQRSYHRCCQLLFSPAFSARTFESLCKASQVPWMFESLESLFISKAILRLSTCIHLFQVWKKNNAPETAQKILLKNVQGRFAWQVTFFESSSRRSHNKVGGASMWVCCKGQRPHGLCSSSLVPPADVLFLHVSTLSLPTSFSWLSFMPPSCPFLVCILFLFLFRFCFPFLSVFFSSFSPSLFLASQV